jgi:hypothetical protein
MAITSLPRQEYKPGYLFANTGHVGCARDRVDEKIPQLNALLTVLAGDEDDWCDEIKKELLYLAKGLANEIHEALAEDQISSFNTSMKKAA